MTEPIRVLVADDHPAIRAGVRALLGLCDGVEVIGEAGSGEATVDLASRLQPDVVLMDLRMPDTGGIDATRAIVRDSPHVAVLMLTMVDDDDAVFAALRAGARGYLVKEAGHEELCRAVTAAGRGEFITSPRIAQQVSAFFAAGSSAQGAVPFPTLTAREREVLHLIATGANNSTIARRLTLSPKTIRNHISSIFAKLQVADRAEAIVRARRAGLGQPPGEAPDIGE